MPDYARIVMPALDFVRAMNERPLWAKLLFRIVCGRSAYREFMFVVTNCHREDLDPRTQYGLHGCDYNLEPQPWRFWDCQLEDDYRG